MSWASYRVVSSSLASVALLLFLVAAMTNNNQQGISPQHSMTTATRGGVPNYRAHEVGTEEGGDGKRVRKFMIQEGTGSGSASELSWRNLSFKEVAGLWKRSGEFVDMFGDISFKAVFFESMPVARNSMDKPYEYVMVDSPMLASVSADGRAFAEYIAPGEGTTEVVSFRNLRKDARLVVPCKAEEKPADYAHLAAFARTAPKEQVNRFFSALGEGLEKEVASRGDDNPVWLSTSGLGVYWLHARLDSVPKYYTYTPYLSY